MNILKQMMSNSPEKGWQWRTRVRGWPGALGSAPYEYRTRGEEGQIVTRWRHCGEAWSPTLKDLVKDKLRDELRYLKGENDPMETAIWTLILPFAILGQILRFAFLGTMAFGFFWPLQQFGKLVNMILDDMESRHEAVQNALEIEELATEPQKGGPGTLVSTESVLRELGDPATWEADRKKLEAQQAQVYDPRCCIGGGCVWPTSCSNCEPKIAEEHRGHGSGDAESGPDDPDCPCRPTAKREECAGQGCGFCLAEAMHAQGRRWVSHNLCGSTSSNCTTDDSKVTCQRCLRQLPQPGEVRPEWVAGMINTVDRPPLSAQGQRLPDHVGSIGPPPSSQVSGEICYLCDKPIPEGPFVKVSDDEVVRAHIACRPHGVVVGETQFVSNGRVYSGECEICHQICVRDEMSYLDLEGAAKFPDGSQQLQVCFNTDCRVKAENLRTLAQLNVPKGGAVQSC